MGNANIVIGGVEDDSRTRFKPGEDFEASGNHPDVRAYLKLGWIEKFEKPELAPPPEPDSTPDEDEADGEDKTGEG